MTRTNPSVIERAFELARSGSCLAIDDIRRQLRRERHSDIDAHLAGMSIKRQLLDLMIAARKQDRS